MADLVTPDRTKPGQVLSARGDARRLPLRNESIDLVITSPPYWGARAYRHNGEVYAGQVGQEISPQEYIRELIDCTREMVRVLRPSGSLFVNLGDKYGRGTRNTISGTRSKQATGHTNTCAPSGYPKSLLMLPQRYALACMDELGLTVRAEIIWRKTNPVPDPARDRVSRGHEVIYHLTKSERYYHQENKLWAIWDMPTVQVRELGTPHAAFPPGLPERIVPYWSPPGGIVLDPFGGTGTVAIVARQHGRVALSFDMSGECAALAQRRTSP